MVIFIFKCNIKDRSFLNMVSLVKKKIWFHLCKLQSYELARVCFQKKTTSKIVYCDIAKFFWDITWFIFI